MVSFLHFLLTTTVLVVVSSASSASNWTQWTCDELTPSLCNLSVTTGRVEIRGVKIKYWRYRRETPSLSSRLLLPIVVLHGGPSWPHNYLIPLKQIACRGSNEVIFYDQAGCGESKLMGDGTNVSEDFPHLLDPAYYSEEELPMLIQHLNLAHYHILGHSWGTVLAQLFALNANDKTGLVSLMLSGPLSDAKNYVKAQWDDSDGTLGSLPPFLQSRLVDLEEKEEYDSAEYYAIIDALMAKFTLRTAPAPECFVKSVEGLNFEIYAQIHGASEFTMKGVLGSLNLTDSLAKINVPTLLTSGRFDTMRPSTIRTMQREIKQSEYKLFPHSGHCSMIDDAKLMNDVIADFLERVEHSLWNGYQFEPKKWEKGDRLHNGSFLRWLLFGSTYVIVFIVGAIVGTCRKLESRRYEPLYH